MAIPTSVQDSHDWDDEKALRILRTVRSRWRTSASAVSEMLVPEDGKPHVSKVSTSP